MNAKTKKKQLNQYYLENKILIFCFIYLLCFFTQASENLSIRHDDLSNKEHAIDKLLIKKISEHNLIQQVQNLPTGNEANGALFDLGKQLFFSKSLSMNNDVACASCHHPLLGGGDGLSLSVGVNAVNEDIIGPGRAHDGDRNIDPLADGGPNVPRNASTIFNLHLLKRAAFWDGRIEIIDNKQTDTSKSTVLRTPDSLMNLPDSTVGDDFIQAQARFPLSSLHEMFGHGPNKFKSNEQKRALVIQKLIKNYPDRKNPWLPLFQEAFNSITKNADQLISLDNVTKALAHYQKSLILVNNPWFDYINGNKAAISITAKKGALLFYNSSKQGGYQCYQCHKGASFSDEKFYNLATPQIGRGKDGFGNDHGRLSHTSNIQDKYKFRTPLLLNVQVTGPWSHAGAFIDLKNIIKHHIQPKKSLHNYDFSLAHLSQFTNYSANQQRSKALSLEALKQLDQYQMKSTDEPSNIDQDTAQLEAFLFSLTDPCILQKACLQKWFLTNNDLGPDSKALQAKFASFTEQPDTYRPAAFKGDIIKSEVIVNPNEIKWFSDVTTASGLSYSLAKPSFSDEYHLMGGGVAVDDFNHDGWLDLFISHSMQPGKLLVNNGKGSFVDVTEKIMGKLSERQLGALFFDYDADGDKDLLLVEDDINQGYFRLYAQLPSGVMRPVYSKAGISFKRFTHSLSAGDYDGDGDLDLFASHWGDVITPIRKGYLWKNSGVGMFDDVSHLLPQTRVSPLYPTLDVNFVPIFSDIDNDNDPDLLIAADYETTQVLRNDDGRYVDNTADIISDENGMGSAVGDYDNDGDLDWFVSSIWNPVEQKAYKGGTTGNRLYNNDGTGRFNDVTDIAGVRHGYWGWGACFADFNNDGWLDIFHTNGMRTGRIAENSAVGQFYQDPSRLFINNQDGTFTEASQSWGITHTAQGRGISCLDYDKDGDIDILIANNGASPTLYKNNNLADNNYLSVKLLGNKQNPDAVGAKISITIGTNKQLREIRLGSNYLSNDPLIAHFGIGKNKLINSLKVTWPNGVTNIFHNIEVNNLIEIKQ
ncbi:FG-GAP-like repeat-containing protein [Colwellia sp. MB02u-9]|uniref:FG-GAP-like repeat-containing protein n=1 Tax=Colwellia sp. MB02u-9 TaxID=2759823 RepID=UPI0015F737E6|nr:FG-GAP-like repeat-containing protein [Colwellia sp. MB02u-9]MBA6297789.1 VCBS repeat-containing protein [Colwellia sp. MB02u-9]